MQVHAGNLLLYLALFLSAYSAIAAVVGARTRSARWQESAVHGVYALLLVYTTAVGLLVQAFLRNDFSLDYVAGHSSQVLPRFYAATGMWSGMEGSLTFWSFILAVYTAYAVARNRDKAPVLIPYVILTLAGTQFFFSFVQLFLSNPFVLTEGFVPADGRGMNPQLQNPGMAFHPPMLYLGYVGCAVPFAFAMAALLTNRLDDQWIRITRKMTLLAWLFLSIGIILGAWWAYVELGWGGYWAWDPVENASLMPWLTATAFLHSIMIQERRDMLRVWNMILVFLTFFLSIMGTFLTRSGFVQSVHSFAASSIGWYFLGFMGILLLYFLIPFLIRLPVLRSKNRLESLLSKEASFLYNNWLFIALLVVVVVGTLGEPISKLATGVATTFRAPYFNALSVPIGILLLFLTGIGPAIAWRRAGVASLRRAFLTPVLIALGITIAIGVAGYAAGPLDLVGQVSHRYAMITFFSCAFVSAVVVLEYVQGALVRHRQTGVGFLRSVLEITLRNGRRYGGYIIHLGVVCMFAGFAGGAFNQEAQKALKPGETMSIGSYDITLADSVDVSRPSYQGVEIRVNVSSGGDFIGTYGLQKRFYYREEQPTTEVAFRSSVLDDLYLILISFEDTGEAVIKAHLNPLVLWLWLGGFLMVGGTAFALVPSLAERRATASEAASPAATEPATTS